MKRLYARAPAGEEKRKLKSMARSKDFTKRTRASIVLESSDGLSVAGIAAKLHLNKHTVRLWIKRFNAEGTTTGLDSRPVPGRRPSITDEQKDEIMRVASTDPRSVGMNFTTWSLSSLKEHLEKSRVVKRISRSWLRSVLIKRGFDASRARSGSSARIRIMARR
jgi:transposase